MKIICGKTIIIIIIIIVFYVFMTYNTNNNHLYKKEKNMKKKSLNKITKKNTLLNQEEYPILQDNIISKFDLKKEIDIFLQKQKISIR